jgi:hypothetical protein
MPSAAIIDLERTLDGLIAQDHTAMADPLLLDDTERLLAAKVRLDAVLARRLQRVDSRNLTFAAHGRQTRSWLIEGKLLDATDAARRMTVARKLPSHPELEDAFAGARLNHDHARVILACLRRTPCNLREVVEKELIKAAETVDPAMLGTFCRELVSRLGGDEDAAAAEQGRFSRRWARLVNTFDGMVRLDAMLDPFSAATIRAAIAPLLERAGDVDDRCTAQRTADALVALAEPAMADGVLPEQGGEKPQLIVTMNYPDFIAGAEDKLLAIAKLNGVRISGSTARMLACDAGIIPIVPGPCKSLPRPPHHLPLPRRTNRCLEWGAVVPLPPLAHPPQRLEHHQRPPRQDHRLANLTGYATVLPLSVAI